MNFHKRMVLKNSSSSQTKYCRWLRKAPTERPGGGAARDSSSQTSMFVVVSLHTFFSRSHIQFIRLALGSMRRTLFCLSSS